MRSCGACAAPSWPGLAIHRVRRVDRLPPGEESEEKIYPFRYAGLVTDVVAVMAGTSRP